MEKKISMHMKPLEAITSLNDHFSFKIRDFVVYEHFLKQPYINNKGIQCATNG